MKNIVTVVFFLLSFSICYGQASDPKPGSPIPAFKKKYAINRYPNIKVGTEGTSYVLRNYYRLDRTPFTAGYDKRGKLSFSYKNEPPLNELFARLKKL